MSFKLKWLFLRFGRLRLTLARKGLKDVDGLFTSICYDTKSGAIAPPPGQFGGAVRNAGRASSILGGAWRAIPGSCMAAEAG